MTIIEIRDEKQGLLHVNNTLVENYGFSHDGGGRMTVHGNEIKHLTLENLPDTIKRYVGYATIDGNECEGKYNIITDLSVLSRLRPEHIQEFELKKWSWTKFKMVKVRVVNGVRMSCFSDPKLIETKPFKLVTNTYEIRY